jgi:hypothetical protein
MQTRHPFDAGGSPPARPAGGEFFVDSQQFTPAEGVANRRGFATPSHVLAPSLYEFPGEPEVPDEPD